ncbi:Ig-like domain-containing protein [Vibrio parahaemolyticus]|nr:Ig-like domain-containing protein [Vibrio parahaemolyticus]
MSQLFRDDEVCNYFFKIINTTKGDNYINELVKMSKEASSSQVFGYALYDSGAFPQLSNLSRDFFANNYEAILDAMTSAGVFNSYILLIRQIIGDSTVIFHEVVNPGHLSLRIVKTESEIQKLATSDELQLATSNNLGLLVTVPVSDYTVMQLLKTLQALCQPAGIYVDVRTIYPSSIEVSPLDEIISIGDQVKYNAMVTYDDGTTDNRVMWESSDSSIVAIKDDGTAIGLSAGIVTIYASPIGVDSFKSSTTLTVVAKSTTNGTAYLAPSVRSRKRVVIKTQE